MARPFIRIEKTLDAALSFRESVINLAFDYTGVQLIPNNTNAYTQTSDNSEGVELEDWTVFAVTLCGIKTDITDYFMVFANITDDDGMPQIIWQLKNVPYDFGQELIYLEINQIFGETFYSSPFLLTKVDEDKTARFDYKEKKEDWYQSIQLNTFFRQKQNKDELTTYYEVSTKETVTSAIKEVLIEKWQTGLFNNELFVDFKTMLNFKYVYCNLTKVSLYEAFEIPEIVGNVNYAMQDYLLAFKYKNIINENINEMSILADIEFLMAVVKPITDMGVIFIWDKPAIDIPVGYEETFDIAGKYVAGHLDADPDFGTLGGSGGSKTDTITLGLTNIPAHRHATEPRGGYGTGDGAEPFEGSATGSALTGYAGGNGTTAGTAGTTDSFTVDTLSPFYIAKFIKWVGLP